MNIRCLNAFTLRAFTLSTFTLLTITSSALAENYIFEKCEIQIQLLGQSTVQEQTIPLNPENTAHISNRTNVQELEEGRIVTAVMCVAITGEASEEQKAFQPAAALQQMIARIEQSGIVVTDNQLLDADTKESHRRGFELNATQADQPIYARGMFIQKPGEMLSYSVFVLGSTQLKAKIVSELRKTIESIKPLAVTN